MSIANSLTPSALLPLRILRRLLLPRFWHCCYHHYFTTRLLQSLAFSTPRSEVAQEASTDVVAFSTPTSEVARHIQEGCPLQSLLPLGASLATDRAFDDFLCQRQRVKPARESIAADRAFDDLLVSHTIPTITTAIRGIVGCGPRLR